MVDLGKLDNTPPPPEARYKMEGALRLRGNCPAGCGETLYAMPNGVIVCIGGRKLCPYPNVVTEMLSNAGGTRYRILPPIKAFHYKKRDENGEEMLLHPDDVTIIIDEGY